MPSWAIRHPDFAPVTDLPIQPVHGKETDDSREHDGEWDRRLDELLTIRQLEDDWDGQGSPAPTVEVVDSALVLALLLRKNGIVPPTGVVQGVQGEVSFDWQSPDGKYVELNVTGAYSADVFVHVPGEPVKFSTLLRQDASGTAA